MPPVLLPAKPELRVSQGPFSATVDHLHYTFSPIPLVHKVLIKIKRDWDWVILIAPAWPRQHWFTTLLGLSVEAPLPPHLYPDLISRGLSWLLHLTLSSLYLTACKLRG